MYRKKSHLAFWKGFNWNVSDPIFFYKKVSCVLQLNFSPFYGCDLAHTRQKLWQGHCPSPAEEGYPWHVPGPVTWGQLLRKNLGWTQAVT